MLQTRGDRGAARQRVARCMIGSPVVPDAEVAMCALALLSEKQGTSGASGPAPPRFMVPALRLGRQGDCAKGKRRRAIDHELQINAVVGEPDEIGFLENALELMRQVTRVLGADTE
jgi:hypothetical protein